MHMYKNESLQITSKTRILIFFGFCFCKYPTCVYMLTVFCHHFDALGGWKHAYPPVPARLAIGAVEFPRVIESVLTALVSSVERRTHETTDAIC